MKRGMDMKKMISLCLTMILLAGLLVLPAFAASSSPKVSYIGIYSDGELYRSQSYEYDKNGRLELVWLWEYGEDEDTYSRIVCTYDKKGGLKEAWQEYDDGYGYSYRYTHTYNSKNQITKTAGKLVATSTTEDDYTIWEDASTFKYDKSGRVTTKSRDYYGTIITHKYTYADDRITVTERAVSEGEEVNSNTSYYMTHTGPLRVSHNDDDEFILSHEGLEELTGIYLDDCTIMIDRWGRIVELSEVGGKQRVEIEWR